MDKVIQEVSEKTADELRALDDAARLYLPLPQEPVSSKRALYRLALFQAGGCEHRMRVFIQNVREALGRPALAEREVPVGLVRDVALPRFSRKRLLQEEGTGRTARAPLQPLCFAKLASLGGYSRAAAAGAAAVRNSDRKLQEEGRSKSEG